MSATYFGSPLRAGSGTLTDGIDGGNVMMTKTVTVTTNSDGTASSATIVIPRNSQITNFIVDTMVDEAVGGGTATAIPLSIGTVAAGTQYMSATDAFAGGRIGHTHTTAQLAAMANVGANQNVVITADPNGTILTTQAVYRMTVNYVQPSA